ncbi:MAG: hypothetical protein AAFY76_12875, partial [Cyanobacteria bacterium J06649_11]
STTILGGEVIFALSDAFGGDPPGTGKANTTFTQLTRLQTTSTFSGKESRLDTFVGTSRGTVGILRTFPFMESLC